MARSRDSENVIESYSYFLHLLDLLLNQAAYCDNMSSRSSSFIIIYPLHNLKRFSLPDKVLRMRIGSHVHMLVSEQLAVAMGISCSNHSGLCQMPNLDLRVRSASQHGLRLEAGGLAMKLRSLYPEGGMDAEPAEEEMTHPFHR